MTIGSFPFGQPIQRVAQTDRGPKRVFVLGVYASAVHARWCNARGRQLVRALAVASEPCIFWRGDESGADVKNILSEIDVPTQVGRLEPAARNLNGPSGRSLDEDYLEPLGLSRNEAWLCDLVPHSCMNPGQKKAVDTHYTPAGQATWVAASELAHGSPQSDRPDQREGNRGGAAGIDRRDCHYIGGSTPEVVRCGVRQQTLSERIR